MKKFFAAIAVIVALALVGFGGWYFANSSTTYSGAPEAITLGVRPDIVLALPFIAEDRGLFARNGLAVTLSEQKSPPAAVAALKDGQLDVAFASEYNVVSEAFKKEDIRLLGVIDKQQAIYVVGRRDRGLENIADLKGKKIGVSKGGIPEFHVGRLLNLEGVRVEDVTFVDIESAQRVEALANGQVDAALVTRTNFDQAKKRLGDNAVVWSAKRDQVSHVALVSRQDWLTRHPEAVKRLLRALVQAEAYVVQNPAAAQAIVQKRFKYDDATLAALWSENDLSVSLEQSLVSTMLDEARWMIKNNLATEKQIPDFSQYIHLDGLKAVKPGAVTIVQ